MAGAVVAVSGSSGSRFRWFCVGVLVSVAILVSMQLLPLGLALLPLARRRLGVSAYFAGGSVILSIVGVWLAIGGALPAAIDAVVVYNRAYVANHTWLQPSNLQSATVTLLFTLGLWALGLARLAGMLRRRSGSDIEVISALWLVGWVAYVAVQQNFFPHYVIAVVPPLAVMAGGGLATMVDLPSRSGRRLVTASGAVAVAISIFMTILVEPGPSPYPQPPAMAQEIKGQTSDTATLFVWGNEPYTYLLADRTFASKYIYLFPLTSPGYTTPDMVADVLTAWRIEPPEVVVDASVNPRGVQAHPLLQPWAFDGSPPPDHLDPLRTFVRERYEEVARIGDWRLYMIKQ
jgi:hypothetical protein